MGLMGPVQAVATQPVETQRAGTSRHRPASIRSKLPGLDSNQDKESQNLLAPDRKSRQENDLRADADACCTTGCTGEQGEGGTTDPDLRRLVAAWPTLPEPIRAAIRALLGAAGG